MGCFFLKVKTRGVFCKKSEKWGCFEKVESRSVFRKKSGKWRCFVKSGPFLNAGCIMYSIGIFLCYTLHIWGGGVRTRRTAVLPTGREHASSIASVTVCVKRIATMQLGCCQCRSSAGMPRH